MITGTIKDFVYDKRHNLKRLLEKKNFLVEKFGVNYLRLVNKLYFKIYFKEDRLPLLT